tara:strand:- start:1187 stop:1513 length:327 start_codon:yes stop_codon:yes gene_type:complete
VTVINANCPSCEHPFSISIETLKIGGEKKTRLCENCGQYIKFEYKLNMASTRKKDRLYLREDWMRRKYLDEGKTMQEIADICGVSAMTIRNWLVEHNIHTRGRGQRGS